MQHYVGVNYEEFLVVEALEKDRWRVYVPTKDVGIDLLAERDGRTIRLQVKGSRTFPILGNDNIPWCSWTQLRPDALRRADKTGVNLFVFVVWAPDERGRRTRIAPFYVIISPADLESRLAAYRPGKSERAVCWYREHRDDHDEFREVQGRCRIQAAVARLHRPPRQPVAVRQGSILRGRPR